MPSIIVANPSLAFGSLDLLGRDQTGPYWFKTSGDDHDPGNPVPVETEITSFLQDGSIKSTQSYGNREMTLTVVVCGEDSYGLAAGEAALIAEVGKRNLLTWTPPNILTGAGEPCVFDVVNSNLDFTFDDIQEINALERTYKLTISALPFARSDTLVSLTDPARAATTPTITTIDACSSLTGWAANPVGSNTTTSTTTVSGDASVKAVFTRNVGTGTFAGLLGFTRSGLSEPMTTTPFVRLVFTTATTGTSGVVPAPTVYLNGVAVSAVAASGTVAWYPSPGTTLTSVKVEQKATLLNPGTITVIVTDISRSSASSDLPGGQRQTFRTLAVSGSTRTPGSLALADETPTALGSTLVYTVPNALAIAQPPLRVVRTAGSSETTDTSTISGKYSDLGTLHTFDLPAAQVPSGTYLLMARIRQASAGTYTLTWAGRSRVGSTNDTGQSGTQSTTLAAATWTTVPVASLTLPTRGMGVAGLVRIELSSTAGVQLDEAWLFNIDDGRLTWAEAGSATPSAGASANRLWLDPASLDNPSPSVWLGFTSDRSDAFGAGSSLFSFGAHEFVPPSMNIFTVTSNSVAVAVTLSYYPAYHSHVA